MLPRDTRWSLPISLLKAREAVMSSFRPVLVAHDITELQWRALRVLEESGPLEAAELSERAFIQSPSLTRIIKSLEERGLIDRRRHQLDRRRAILTIKPRGLTLLHNVAPDSSSVYGDIEGKLGKVELEALLVELQRFAEVVSIK